MSLRYYAITRDGCSSVVARRLLDRPLAGLGYSITVHARSRRIAPVLRPAGRPPVAGFRGVFGVALALRFVVGLDVVHSRLWSRWQRLSLSERVASIAGFPALGSHVCIAVAATAA